MTTTEAIEELKARKEHYEMGDGCEFLVEALDIAINVMENLNHNELKNNLNTLNRESRIDELEKLRKEIELIDFDFGDYYDYTDTIIEMVSKVIDNRIERLKE